MNIHYRFAHHRRLTMAAVCALTLLVAATALAEDGALAAAVAAPVLTERDASWIGMFTAIFVTAAQFVDPANLQTPGNWSGPSRMVVFTILGALVGFGHFLTAHTGAPIMSSVFTGILTIVLPALGHFATGFGKRAAAARAGAARGAQAGFTRVGPMLIALAASACAGAIAAIVPAAALVACAALVDIDSPGLTFLQFVTKAAVHCETDEVAILGALIGSTDPRLAPRKAEAVATKADPAKLAALHVFVAAHRAEYHHPAAP